ncbi:MAG: metal-dependent hydrolase [Anaerolineales bacterium]|nr:metal-dependent hydrolase [Anaerolineales bacterium]
MKGIAHFLTGVALATCIPEVATRAAAGSLLPALGGVAGLLPDTLDFKFTRFLESTGTEIDPGAEPDARRIAEQVSAAVQRAFQERAPQRVTLHTVRLGADRWRRYEVHFDGERCEVSVHIGPQVSTSQIAVPQSEPTGDSSARVPVGLAFRAQGAERVVVDIFSGPTLAFERIGDTVTIDLQPWHRRWSHSLVLAVALGLGVAALTALVERWRHAALSRLPLLNGLVVALALAAHIAEDQLGYMGSNLGYPFTRRRTPGLKLFHAGDAAPNFLTVWVSLALIMANLARSPSTVHLSPWLFVLIGGAPVVVVSAAAIWRRARVRPEHLRAGLGAGPQREVEAETEDALPG